MSRNIRLAAFALPLIAFAFWGAVHTPSNGQPGGDFYDEDVVFSELPPLPEWAEQALPDFSVHTESNSKKSAFFSFLYPRVVLANARIAIQRGYLNSLSQQDTLTDSETAWLEAQAKRLRVEAEPASAEMFKRLDRKMDIIAPSLILAQAANESAWGTSRFARKGNNLFGQWCFSEGCGLVPKGRNEGASHEVAAFSSPYQSIRGYIQNLNSHPAYKPLRDTRATLRAQGKPLSGNALAAGLLSYSERGEEYVKEIRSMIDFNNLGYYDQAYRNRAGSASELKDLASAEDIELLKANYGEG
ncbi:MAG: glucosaminidase domain-containing protein [Oleiphilaceae bacterium]|nr:glucosaminidase domain-containing protein [Oleiphilaceae bacterium]